MKFAVNLASGDTMLVDADEARIHRSGALIFLWVRAGGFDIFTEGVIKCFAPHQWRSYEPISDTSGEKHG